MSIPGLGKAHAAEVSAPIIAAATVNVLQVPANSEWRFEVGLGQKIDLRVLSGTAELFGTELALNHTYTFRGTKAAIFTWHGARLEVTGICEEYIAEETPMTQYVNTHFALEKLRDEAALSNKYGPCVLVVGPNNAGKTSLVKILTGYAIKMGRQPMVVNTDSREGLLSIPGSMTATPFASILDVEQGWGSSPTSTSSPVPVKLPLCYYYGLPSPEDNTKLYKPTLSRLALASISRFAEDPSAKATGMIIDTPGVISQGKGGYDLISHIVSEFSVNVVLALGSERLHSEMVKRFAAHRTREGEQITLVKLDKSGGCVDRDDNYLQQSREASIKEYFFGTPSSTLSPHTQQLPFSELTIYRIKPPITSDFLSSEAEPVSTFNPSLYDRVEPSQSMLHCILAVMYAGVGDGEGVIRDAPVMGFVYVASVDEVKRRIKVLAPMNTRIVDRPMIWGTWPEAAMSLMQ